MYAQAMVFEPLVRYQADGSVAPWLATSWTVSDGGRLYTFQLRPDVRFSDGSPFDAAAVVANFEQILTRRPEHSWLALAQLIEEAREIGPLSVQLRLRSPYEPTLKELALPRPFRFKSTASVRSGKPSGTGPWMWSGGAAGARDIFVRNPHYWGAAPHYKTVEVRVITDPNARVVAFQTGLIDLLYGPGGQAPPHAFARLRATPGVVTRMSGPAETSYIAMNSASGPTRDPAVRRAISHAVNKDALVTTLLAGSQSRADTLFPRSTPVTDVELKPYGYDPALASTLLDEAGWTRREPQGARTRHRESLATDLVFSGASPVERLIAEAVQADLAKIGVVVRLVGEDESSIASRQRDGRFGMVFGSTWRAPYDPHAYLASMRAPAHADYQAQRGLADKAAIDAAITALLTVSEPERQAALYRDVLTRLHEAAVSLPLSYVPLISQARSGVDGAPFPATPAEIPFDLMGFPPMTSNHWARGLPVFIIRRLLVLPVLLLGASALIFLLLRLGQADPAMDYLRLNGTPPTDEALRAMRDAMGLDQSLPVQFLAWLGRAIRLEFGVSYATQRPVLDDLLVFFPATVQLTAAALGVTLITSIPLGMWAARRRGAWPDHVTRLLTSIGVSMPGFWLGFLLVMLFSVQLGLLPAMGREGWNSIILPAVAISVMTMANNTRLLRGSMLEVAGQRHVIWARLRGLSERSVEHRHVLRNAMMPLITATGLYLGELIGGALIIESIFGWPGVGRYAVSAIFNRDYPVIQCFALVMVTVFVLCNLVVDVMYAWADPRVRISGGSGA